MFNLNLDISNLEVVYMLFCHCSLIFIVPEEGIKHSESMELNKTSRCSCLGLPCPSF